MQLYIPLTLVRCFDSLISILSTPILKRIAGTVSPTEQGSSELGKRPTHTILLNWNWNGCNNYLPTLEHDLLLFKVMVTKDYQGFLLSLYIPDPSLPINCVRISIMGITSLIPTVLNWFTYEVSSLCDGKYANEWAKRRNKMYFSIRNSMAIKVVCSYKDVEIIQHAFGLGR